MLVVLAAGVAIFRSAGADTVPIEDETATVEVSGAVLPAYGFPDDAIGQSVPTVTSDLLSGDPVTFGADGTARVIAFFAHWCPHCYAEVPEAKTWLADTGCA